MYLCTCLYMFTYFILCKYSQARFNIYPRHSALHNNVTILCINLSNKTLFSSFSLYAVWSITTLKKASTSIYSKYAHTKNTFTLDTSLAEHTCNFLQSLRLVPRCCQYVLIFQATNYGIHNCHVGQCHNHGSILQMTSYTTPKTVYVFYRLLNHD